MNKERPSLEHPIYMKITVSFVIPTKNRPKGVRQAVTSVLAALPMDGEVIVVDDGSVLPAREILSDIKDPRLKCFENPGPYGPSAARNYGVSLAKADLLMFLDDDDLLVEDYCTRVMKRLRDLPPDCTFGFSASYYLESDGTQALVLAASPEGLLGDETLLKFRQAGLGMGCWITRSAFDSVGGLDQDIDVNEDTEFSIRLAAAGHRCYCDQTPGIILIQDLVREIGDQASITRAAAASHRFSGFEYILTKHRGYLLGHTAFRRKMLSRVLKYRSRAGVARGWLSFSARHRPLSDVVLIGVPGTLWLGVSILVRAMKKVWRQA